MANSALEKRCATCDYAHPLLLCPCCESKYYCSYDHLEQDDDHHQHYCAFISRALATANTPQAPTCKCCGSTRSLLLCSNCEVVYYCSPEHVEQDQLKHRQVCERIGKLKATIIRDGGRELIYWNYHDGTSSPRFSLANALRGGQTAVAAEKSLRHFLVLLYTDGYNAARAALIIPEILLQLGRDQESYNFIWRWTRKQYQATTIGMVAPEIRGNRTLHTKTEELLRYQNEDDVDLFETPQRLEWMFIHGGFSKSRILSMTLIKTKLLYNVSDLHAFTASGLCNRFPTEISDMIRYAMVEPAIGARRDVVEDHDQSARIAMLEDQIEYLIGMASKQFWEALFDHEPHRISWPGSRHSRELNSHGLRRLAVGQAWRDNPRAGELFVRRAKVSPAGRPTALSIDQQNQASNPSGNPLGELIGQDYLDFE